MANPPFNPDETIPGDSDIVSTYPAQARQFRDIMESWMLVDHDTNGHHAKVTFAEQATEPEFDADQIGVYMYAGQLRTRAGTEASRGVVPTGVILDYAGATAPSGFLLCYGQEVSRETYANLFAVIGETFGAGNGTTTFNVPDLRDRTVVGKGDMGGTAAGRITQFVTSTLGNVFGAALHVLTTGELPPHTHTGTTDEDGLHTHGVGRGDVREGTGGSENFVNNPGSDVETSPGGAHTHTFTTDETGGDGEAHNNVQPSMALNKIIAI